MKTLLTKHLNALIDLNDQQKYQINKTLNLYQEMEKRKLITAVQTLCNCIDRYYKLDAETKEMLKRDIQFCLDVEKQQMIDFAHHFSDLNKLTIEDYYAKNYNTDK